MVGSDKRLAWHPKHENRFLVGGGASITLYEYRPDSEIHHITALHDLQLMKVGTGSCLYESLLMCLAKVLRVVSRSFF